MAAAHRRHRRTSQQWRQWRAMWLRAASLASHYQVSYHRRMSRNPVDAYVEIRRTAAETEARLAGAATCIGLTALHAAALVLLSRVDPKPVKYLSRALGLAATSSTYLADVLEKAGYVERRFSKLDRRVHDLALTDAGRVAVARFLAALAEAEPSTPR